MIDQVPKEKVFLPKRTDCSITEDRRRLSSFYLFVRLSANTRRIGGARAFRAGRPIPKVPISEGADPRRVE
jgi:hypothetical protein